MTVSDRAFHALAQAEPEVVMAALRALIPRLAAGARAVEMSDEALCARVAAALIENNASWYQRHMAVITAATQRRLQALTEAMARADAPPVIIEDTFFLAMEEGEKIGATKAAAEALLRVLAARGLAVTEAERARVLACADLAKLEGWITRAVTLPTVAEVLRETPATGRATSPRKHARRPRP